MTRMKVNSNPNLIPLKKILHTMRTYSYLMRILLVSY
jgi:hypothetical protein